jgi:hypothetical protein
MKQVTEIKMMGFKTNLTLYNSKEQCINENNILLPKNRAEYGTKKELDQNVICRIANYYTCCSKILWNKLRRNDFYINNQLYTETDIIKLEQ